MYKSAKQIKEILGIDITEKNRKIPFVALRAFYAEVKVKKLPGNITSRYTTIANEIGCSRDNVYNLLKKVNIFKTDECIKILYKAFKTKDKALIEEYHKQFKKSLALKHSSKNIKMFNDGFCYVQKPKQKTEISTLSNLKLAEYLRTNKVLKHKLWDTPIRNISDKQWKQVRTINTEMFDNFANN